MILCLKTKPLHCTPRLPTPLLRLKLPLLCLLKLPLLCRLPMLPRFLPMAPIFKLTIRRADSASDTSQAG